MTTKETKRTGAKVMVSGRMDPRLLARAKAVVFWTPGLTLSRLLEDALALHLEELERKSGPVTPAPGPLRPGRPLSMGGPQ